MKICFLGDASSVHLHKWVHYFKKIGWNVTIISFKEYEIEGVDIITLGNGYKVKERGGNYRYLKYLFQIKRILNKIKPDIINAHYITSYGLLASLTKNAPLVLSAWGTDILVTPLKNKLYRFLTCMTVSKADLITSDSENMTEEIKKMLLKKNIDILTVPMGVDIDLLYNKRDFQVNSPKILSLRTLNNNSNIHNIIKSFAKILEKYPEARLVIGNDGDLKSNLINLCKQLEIDNNVEFMGFLDRNSIVSLLKNCDFYISIPTSDATSVTLLEAMASGIFPIVSDIPANGEWITNGINGCAVNIDSFDIATCVFNNYTDVQQREKVAELNYKIISERASLNDNMEIIAKNFIKINEDLHKWR